MTVKLSNDEAYQNLMQKYKTLRRNPAKAKMAVKYLNTAQEMDAKGMVSPGVVTAWQYLG
jgi:hypothetical protein